MNETDTVKEEKRRPKKRRLSTPIIVSTIVVLLAVGISVFFYLKSKKAEDQLNNPDATSQKVIDETIKRVGKHILLPTDEQPTLATVKDVDKVKGQPFFARSEYGDKVLVYTQARKAILYRPSKDIIIEVAPLSIDTKL